MGQSQTSTERPNNYLLTNDKLDNFKEYSSYRGVKSKSELSNEMLNKTREESMSKSNSKSKSSTNGANDLKEVVFTWDKPGKEVYVTGSFADWKQWFILEKQGNKFSRKVLLPKVKIYFKFIVDNVWCYSEDYIKENDEKGNINNVIDIVSLSNSIKNKDKINSRTINTKNSLQKNKIIQVDSYSYIFPERSSLNSNAPFTPNDYLKHVMISNNDKCKKQCFNLDFLEKRVQKIPYFYTNNATSSMPFPSHVNM